METGSTHQIVNCILCPQKLRIPRNIGQIWMTCPSCETQWEFFTGKRLTPPKSEAKIHVPPPDTPLPTPPPPKSEFKIHVPPPDTPLPTPPPSNTVGQRLSDLDRYETSVPPITSSYSVASKRNAVGSFAYTIWAWGTLVAMPYHNWKFAQQHGFADWLFFGQIVPTLRAIFWPLSILFNHLSAS